MKSATNLNMAPFPYRLFGEDFVSFPKRLNFGKVVPHAYTIVFFTQKRKTRLGASSDFAPDSGSDFYEV